MNTFFLPIIIPFIVGLAELFTPKKPNVLHKGILLLTTLANFALVTYIFILKPEINEGFWKFDNLSLLIVLAIGFFGFMVSLYSLNFFSDDFKFKEFSVYALLTLGAASGAALINDFIFLVLFWGFLGLTLYMLVNLSPEAAATAKKTFIIIGATDALMIIGIAIIWVTRGNWFICERPLEVTGINIFAFICLALAALAKAGAIPVHTWVPDVAEKSSVPVTALLPASLDKLLGIYFLTRIVTNIFVNNALVSNLLLVVGALTVIIGVMMALVQHNIKRLLGYHAVSQVGYMVIGIGTGNLIGLVGGLFHMLNNTIYKSSLFLTSGSVEKRTKTSDLDNLGGLSGLMPITFACTVITSLSIAGIPPFNGFVSKWLIYQGLVVSYMRNNSILALFVLIAAMIGSALTLASFMKLIHATFLASPKKILSGIKEVPLLMWLPSVILSALCILFGIFSDQIPLKYLIPRLYRDSIGLWQPGIATSMILIGLFFGIAIYVIFFLKHNVRKDDSFIGGENTTPEQNPSGTEFYNTISNFAVFKPLYRGAEKKYFDIYDVTSKVVFFFSGIISKLHSGILHTYLAWVLIGALFLFWVLK